MPSKREFRALVIEMVLATDMSCHFQQIKAMKNALQQPEGWVTPQHCAVKSCISAGALPLWLTSKAPLQRPSLSLMSTSILFLLLNFKLIHLGVDWHPLYTHLYSVLVNQSLQRSPCWEKPPCAFPFAYQGDIKDMIQLSDLYSFSVTQGYKICRTQLMHCPSAHGVSCHLCKGPAAQPGDRWKQLEARTAK